MPQGRYQDSGGKPLKNRLRTATGRLDLVVAPARLLLLDLTSAGIVEGDDGIPRGDAFES